MKTDLTSLLKGRPDCPCGRPHNCAMQRVILEPGAVRRIGEAASGWNHVLLVADSNTWSLCGQKAAKQLGGRLSDTLVYTSQGLLVPDEDAIRLLDSRVKPDTDLIVGIGSGVINDLCKYVSFTHGIDYFIVATAPSMDGYASVHAAMIIGGMKITYPAHMVHTIIADTDLLKDAPMEMIQSGYGDIIGKFSALNDWKLTSFLYGDYFCPEVYDLILEATRETARLGPALVRRDPEAVRSLMEALIAVGIAMAWVGNSRPASGSEHHLSHYFEVTGLLRHEPYFLHGLDVAYSTAVTARLRERLLELPEVPDAAMIPEKVRLSELRRVYGTAADGILELQDRVGRYREDLPSRLRPVWDGIRAILSEVPGEEAVCGMLRDAGIDLAAFPAMYDERKRRDALLWAKDLKDRFTVLWIWYALQDAVK